VPKDSTATARQSGSAPTPSRAAQMLVGGRSIGFRHLACHVENHRKCVQAVLEGKLGQLDAYGDDEIAHISALNSDVFPRGYRAHATPRRTAAGFPRPSLGSWRCRHAAAPDAGMLFGANMFLVTPGAPRRSSQIRALISNSPTRASLRPTPTASPITDRAEAHAILPAISNASSACSYGRTPPPPPRAPYRK
jgi:hypothetical protein